MSTPLLDFHNIVPHLGAKDEAFEELCCQNAWHLASPPQGSEHIRYRGAGGDGGVECVWRLPSGKEWGWQVKYIFDLSKSLPKLTESFDTALKVHPELERYTVCLPFNLTGPTGKVTRTGKATLSELEKFEEWRESQHQKAAQAGIHVTIHLETASTILGSLQNYDSDGGRLRFWFDTTAFGEGWFSKHITEAVAQAGPRYTPRLSITVPVAQVFEGLGLTERWFDEIQNQRKLISKASRDWQRAVATTEAGGWSAPFPDALRAQGEEAASSLSRVLGHLNEIVASHKVLILEELMPLLTNDVLPRFRELRGHLARLIDETHGEGSAESAAFRQFEAEYGVNFPAANLDRADDVIKCLDALWHMFSSAAACTAGKNELLVTGEAGSGKTHAICDAAVSRLERGLRTVVLFGERFSGASEPWIQIAQQLGVSGNVSRDELLGALDAAGEASGFPLLLCIDGLNETVPRSYWQNHLASVVEHVRRYPFVRLCLSCRSTYLSQVLPEGANDWQQVDHKGFSGIEFDACRAFFDYYGLAMPMTPILQAEFANPLFLRLICTAAKECQLKRIPIGWQGIFTAVSALMTSKDNRFAKQFGVSSKHRVPDKGLQAFVYALRMSSRSSLPFDEASSVIQSVVPAGANCGILIDWLVEESLLIVDAEKGEGGGDEDFVRISFDRLGDHLLASKFLDEMDGASVANVFSEGGALAFVLESVDATDRNRGLLQALAIQVPERFGFELTECLDSDDSDPAIERRVVEAVVTTLIWRDPSYLTEGTAAVVGWALSIPGMADKAFDGLIEAAVQPSPVDALYMHSILSSCPMARRDGYWCPHLFRSFEEKLPAERLIRAGLEMDVDHLDDETLERWATILLWFCAAADRRVRDYASKAAVRITSDSPGLWAKLIERFADCDDEYVLERCLLCAYGSLLRNRDLTAERLVADAAYKAVFRIPAHIQNALIRDHARCIMELALADGVLPEGIAQASYMPPYESEWPLAIPSEDELEPFRKQRGAYPKLYMSCTDDDFFVYTLSRLNRYEHTMSRRDMGRWVFKQVLDMGYSGTAVVGYDAYMLRRYGGGRGKPSWAERIGKKYQWIALSRLAARLTDHVEPESDDWSPKPQAVPLVYMGGRDLDPSVLARKDERASEFLSWWQPVGREFGRPGTSDAQWVSESADVPDGEALINVVDTEGKTWLALECHPDWEEQGEEDEDGETRFDGRRSMWMQVRSYLVAEEDFATCWEWISVQQFMERWMLEGAEFHKGFVGEYPWATPFRVYPDTWSSRGSSEKAPCALQPTCSSLASSEEYDAYQASGITLRLPTRTFFEGAQFAWDGDAGYRDEHGKTIFQDPSFSTPGPSALLVDPEFLDTFLANRKMRIVWTVLAERLVYGDNAKPRLQFSRVYTLADGKLIASSPITGMH